MGIDAGDVVTGLGGTYRIEARHGEGSFGITYRARCESDGATVIVKELRIEKLDDWKALELFEREGRVLASLTHPNIPAFRDFFAHGGPKPLPVSALSSYEGPEHLSLVLVQQFIEGTTLQQRLDLGQRLPPAEAVDVVRSLLGALHYLHERTPPLVHRDIKPGNIILTPDGRPYLVDFGAIQDRLQSAGSVGSTIVGTLGYMPPEQTRGDARPVSDLYALGMTIIVSLAGKPLSEIPFDDATGRIATDRAVPSGTPTGLRRALDGMTAPLLGQRAQSAQDVLSQMDAPERSKQKKRRGGEGAESESASATMGSGIKLGLGGISALALVASAYAFGVSRGPRSMPIKPTPRLADTTPYVAPVAPQKPARNADGTTSPRVTVGTSPVQGSALAPVTIVEFSDFQCPFCRKAADTVRSLEARYGDRLRVVWKHKPLPFHSRAEPAAELALEARAEKGDAGFWDVHDRLFASPSLEDADLDRIAQDAGLDRDKARAAAQSHRYRAAIDADVQLANTVQVNGTPHFFINGRSLVGAQPAEKFAAIIDAELTATAALLKKGVAPAQLYEARLSGSPAP